MNDLFVEQLTRAIIRCITHDGISHVEDWPPEAEPAPEQTGALAIDVKLPRGVTWNSKHDRIYAYCYVARCKITFSHLRPTAANAALAGRMAAAARACRDAGGDADAVRAAGKGIEQCD